MIMVGYYHYNKKHAGFTSVELLVALMVCSIVLTAVASLAYAIGSANRYSEQRSDHQMALRCATVRISELVKHSVMAFDAPGGGIALWTGDDNNDGLINGSELVYIETGADGQSLRLLDFPGQSQSVTIGEIEAGTAKTDLINNTNERYITLLPECSNVQLILGSGTFVNILFDLTENNTATTYQICATLRCSATSADGGDDD
jgi:type II secretory pathway pseudopilin PulG